MKTLLRLRCLMYSITTAALIMLVAPVVWADDDDDDSDEVTIEFDEAELFFELNNTDGDLGIHSAVDGEPWKKLEMEGPNGRELLEIDVRSRLRRQGLTQLFYESAEPSFDELDPDKFFRRFPAGEYEIEGKSLEGDEIESVAVLTHLIPAAPEASVNGEPIAEECDEDDPGYDAPVISATDLPIVISWPAVERSHEDLGSPRNSTAIEIYNYEVVVEADIEVNGEEFVVKTSTILPPDETSYVVPDDFIGLTDVWKYEVLVREASFNQTAIESCFEVEE